MKRIHDLHIIEIFDVGKISTQINTVRSRVISERQKHSDEPESLTSSFVTINHAQVLYTFVLSGPRLTSFFS